MISSVGITGTLSIWLNDELVRRADNLFVDVGREYVAGLLAGGTGSLTHIAVGLGTSVPRDIDTALQDEVAREAVIETVLEGNLCRFITLIPEGAGVGHICEAGLFDAASGGNMTNRTKFAFVDKRPDDTMTILWTLAVN